MIIMKYDEIKFFIKLMFIIFRKRFKEVAEWEREELIIDSMVEAGYDREETLYVYNDVMRERKKKHIGKKLFYALCILTLMILTWPLIYIGVIFLVLAGISYVLGVVFETIITRITWWWQDYKSKIDF